jgi:hypothetical protein
MKTKIWLYQTNKPILGALEETIQNHLNQFAAQWQAHGKNLQAKFWFHNPYLLVCEVDESVWGASGCSIDSKVRFLKELGAKFDVDFFVRMKTILHFEDQTFEQIDFSEVKNETRNFQVFNPTVVHSDQMAQLFTDMASAPMQRLML